MRRDPDKGQIRRARKIRISGRRARVVVEGGGAVGGRVVADESRARKCGAGSLESKSARAGS